MGKVRYEQAGAAAARAELGITKIALAVPPAPMAQAKSLMHDLRNPAIGGAILGGTAGALNADEGQGARGALLGAGMGAAGAAGGAAVAKGFNANALHGAEQAFNQAPGKAYGAALRQHLAPEMAAAGKAADPAFARLGLNDAAEKFNAGPGAWLHQNTVDPKAFAESPQGKKLWESVTKARESAGRNEVGGAMLGGVAGMGAGMAATPRGAPGNSSQPQLSQYDPSEDPYGYGRQ